MSTLKRRYLTSKLVGVRYAEEIPSEFQLEGTEILKVGRYRVKLRFDTRQTPVEAVIARLAEAGNLVDVTISDPSLEEVIRVIYEEAEAAESKM